MAVGFRSASTAGTTEVLGTSLAVPVPASVATDDVVLVGLMLEGAANPTVTMPGSFIYIGQASGTNIRMNVFGKLLTGADSGNYTFSWTGSMYATGHGIAATGATLTGVQFDDAIGSGTTIGSTTLTTTSAPFLAHFVGNAPASSAKTPPTSFTEGNESGYMESSWRIPGSSGAQTASGGTQDASTGFGAFLVGLEVSGPPPDPPALMTLRPVRSGL